MQKNGNNALKEKKNYDMTGAEVLLQVLVDQGVDIIFGYPGGGCSAHL